MWKSTAVSASMCSLNSCERIRPERARNPIQRLVWGPGAQFQVGYAGLIEEELSCNPRVALRRLLRLYEGRQYREAASFLLRLPCYTFKAALPDIPVDLIVESLPHSLSLLEAVYARLLELVQTNDSSIEASVLVRIEQQVLWRVVHHISTTENLRDAQIWSKLLVTLSRLSPGSKKLLASRRRSLERAVEGLGKHGLVPSNTNVEDRRVCSSSVTTSSRGTFGFAFGHSNALGRINNNNNNNNNNSSSNSNNNNNSNIRNNLMATTTTILPSNITNLSPGEPPTTLLPLTAKLRDELETRLEAYKLALHKIESWGKQSGGGVGVGGGGGVGGTRSKAGDRQVRAASHQRQLSLKYSEVQQRLIDNQSLLNILGKPSDRNLEDLIGELRRRVERDKEALRQWNAVRKSSGLSSGSGSSSASMKNPALAASLLQFSRACSLALRLMNDSLDISMGYQDNGHRTRELENLRDDRFEAAESSSSAGYHTDDSCSPTPEPVVIVTTTTTTTTTNKTTSNNGSIVLEHSTIAGCYTWTTEQLTDRYVALYAHAHLHTLDALDALEPLKDATDLKAKILFSVVVLSWRVAEIVQASRRLEASKILNGNSGGGSFETVTTGLSMMSLSDALSPDPTSRKNNSRNSSSNSSSSSSSIVVTGNVIKKNSNQLDECMNRQLARFGHESGTRQVAERVLSQLERTLYDFPCLRECPELKRYALACSSLAWICLARDSPLILDVAQGFTNFDNEIHARHHASPDSQGTRIIAVLWPGLLLRETTRTSCLYRAVVLTASSISHYVN